MLGQEVFFPGFDFKTLDLETCGLMRKNVSGKLEGVKILAPLPGFLTLE